MCLRYFPGLFIAASVANISAWVAFDIVWRFLRLRSLRQTNPNGQLCSVLNEFSVPSCNIWWSPINVSPNWSRGAYLYISTNFSLVPWQWWLCLLGHCHLLFRSVLINIYIGPWREYGIICYFAGPQGLAYSSKSPREFPTSIESGLSSYRIHDLSLRYRLERPFLSGQALCAQ